MSRIIKIVTTSFGVLEQVAPPYNLRVPSLEENVERARRLLESAASLKPDIVLLPEAFVLAGMPAASAPTVAESIDGPVTKMLSSMASTFRYNLVAGHLVTDGGQLYNRALVFDREGKLVGWYTKQHPVGGELTAGIQPGSDIGVFDLDFGRIGVTICFDIHWPEIWRLIGEANVDVVCWLSAYDGGFPLRSYAWQHKYPIVSSVYSYHAALYDITGEVLPLTSRWQRIGNRRLNLDRELFHTDNNAERIIELQAEYGERITVTTHTQEHLFTVASNDPALSLEEIAALFKLESYKDYIARHSQ